MGDIILDEKNVRNEDIELNQWQEGEPAELVWNRISYTVKGKQILNDISGRAQGQLVGIMGSSGAGKTSLLYLLSDRAKGGEMSGEVLINGEKMTKNRMKELGGFVWQDDLFFSHLTVYETLMFAADMKMGNGTTKKERKAAVEATMDLLALQKCKNNIVGDDFHKGISGGERKRLSIGVELLGRPHLLFLDEPTSGLDSSTAYSVVKSMKSLTSSCTILCTIHQPSASIFDLFDLLCILSFGQVVFFGTPDEAALFYEENGLVPKPFTNPADFVIDTISPDPIDKEAADLAIETRNLLVDCYSDRIRQMNPDLRDENDFDDQDDQDDLGHKPYLKSLWNSLTKKQNEKKSIIYPSQYKSSAIGRGRKRKTLNPIMQFFLLLSRTARNYYRDWGVMLTQLFQNVTAAILIGLVYLNLPLDQSGISRRFSSAYFIALNQGIYAAYAALTSFPMERVVVLRERQAGMYQTLPYYLAKILVELPVQLIFPLIFTNILYWMIDYEITASKYFHFLILVELCSYCAISMGLFCAAVSPKLSVATIITPLILETFRLFGGFFNSPVPLPGWMIWIQGFSFITFTFTGIARNEMTGRVFYCTDEQLVGGVCPTPTGEIAMEKFRLWDISPYQCELVILGMILVYQILAYICVRFNKVSSV